MDWVDWVGIPILLGLIVGIWRLSRQPVIGEQTWAQRKRARELADRAAKTRSR